MCVCVRVWGGGVWVCTHEYKCQWKEEGISGAGILGGC